MANVTEDGNHTTIEEFFCMLDFIKTNQRIVISSFNIPMAITAFLGNVLIIFALKKASSLYPSSKLLFGCLASTDLCVGLITQPILVIYLMSPRYKESCYYLQVLLGTISAIFCQISLITMTAISVDRLLALMLGLRYRQVVTSRKVWAVVVTVWLNSTAIAMIQLYNTSVFVSIVCVELIFCIATSTFCYLKIYFILNHHQALVRDHLYQGKLNRGGISINIARYRKTVASAFWVQITILVCYLPYGIVTALLAITGLHRPSLQLPLIVTLSFVLLNSSLNPFLYCWKMREVRQAVKDTIRQFWCFSN
ncbi:hypothetical protein ACROYT_G033661 [Oculina patagonica]